MPVTLASSEYAFLFSVFITLMVICHKLFANSKELL